MDEFKEEYIKDFFIDFKTPIGNFTAKKNEEYITIHKKDGPFEDVSNETTSYYATLFCRFDPAEIYKEYQQLTKKEVIQRNPFLKTLSNEAESYGRIARQKYINAKPDPQKEFRNGIPLEYDFRMFFLQNINSEANDEDKTSVRNAILSGWFKGWYKAHCEV